MIVLEALLVLVLVDFASGFIHWVEDTFWVEQTPVLGSWLVGPNELHHRDGSAFVRNNWLQSSWDLLLAALAIVAVAWSLDALTWHVWLFAIVGANANQIHKWSHMRDADLPFLVRALQRCRILQSRADHAEHHCGEKNTAYCVITPYVNVVLDKLRFWRTLESVFVPLSLAPRREDMHEKDYLRKDRPLRKL
jgi:ubiquitin-conjugating enzyme E2 variant